MELLVVKYIPDLSKRAFVNIGVIAHDEKAYGYLFVEKASDLRLCSKITNLATIPMNLVKTFEYQLSQPVTIRDYTTYEEKVFQPNNHEYFEWLASNGYSSHVQFSELYSFDIPLTKKLLLALYRTFVVKQALNPDVMLRKSPLVSKPGLRRKRPKIQTAKPIRMQEDYAALSRC